MNARYALRDACERLEAGGAEEPRLDAEILLAAAMGCDRAGLWARMNDDATPEAEAVFSESISRRLSGEPVAYITGRKEFYSLCFEVGRGVFVPRPETEGLVDLAREFIAGAQGAVMADPCTGSGAVAIAARLAAGFRTVHATDVSPEALEFAKRNALRLGARVEFHLGDLLEPVLAAGLAGRFDAICCNPPYVRTSELGSLPEVVKCEPRSALDGGADGLDAVRRLAVQAAVALRPSGALFVEIGPGQGAGALDAARSAGLAGARILEDLAGLERYLVAYGPESGR